MVLIDYNSIDLMEKGTDERIIFAKRKPPVYLRFKIHLD